METEEQREVMTERLYKLTDRAMQTYGGYRWKLGMEVTVKPDADGKHRLCTGTVVHAYRDSLLAVLMNPIHTNITSPRLFEAKGVVVVDNGAKVGCSRLVLLHELKLPQITVTQRTRFAILIALEVCTESRFTSWAQRWLSGADRTADAAWTAEKATATEAVTEAAVAWAAAWAAIAEADAEWAMVAWAAAKAAAAAARTSTDLVALAHQAVKED